MNQKIIIIAGATASGKSARALALAEEKDGVIINADSQQLYADLRILTARPTLAEEERVPHKLYGILPSHEQGSAGKWLRLAKMEIDWVLGEQKTPIVVGGTGLYLKALMQGIAEIPHIEENVQAQAENDYAQMGKESFAERLRHVDPEFFTRLQVVDRQRLIRAYSVWLGSGRPLSFWQQQKTQPAYDPAMMELEIITLPREELYARCDQRVHQMMEEGAMEEVKQLLVLYKNIPESLLKIIGVRELSDAIHDRKSLDEAIVLMQQATRNYAKRQLTWFRHQLNK